ncbi:UNVERIFIED_ORG: RNA-splicing ligase RtcB [Arthrobacter sp. UYCu721]
MIAVRTQYPVKDLPRDRKRLREDIERSIPLSAGHNNRRLPDPDLVYLEEGTSEFTRSFKELRWAQHIALLNREEMMW